MAENDIIVPKENASGGFAEIALAPADIGAAAATHTHGNLTNAGAIGTTSGLPIKTGTSGVLEAGAFGTSAGQFAEGNHTHAITTGVTAGNHKVFYSNGSGQVVELALGAANTVLTSGGESAAPTFAAASGGIAETLLDAKGDLIVASAADTAARLAVGTNGHVLTADSGETTGVKWSALPAGGSTNLWIPASAWIPRTTTGCGVDSREIGSTNRQNFDELLFDAGTDEFAQALVIMPSNYNNSTITARFYWTADSGSGDVIWGIQGRAFANDDALGGDQCGDHRRHASGQHADPVSSLP
jgi:hypothetical protein